MTNCRDFARGHVAGWVQSGLGLTECVLGVAGFWDRLAAADEALAFGQPGYVPHDLGQANVVRAEVCLRCGDRAGALSALALAEPLLGPLPLYRRDLARVRSACAQ